VRKAVPIAGLVLTFFAALFSWQLVSRYGEYYQCKNRAMHEERPIAKEVVRSHCACQHLAFPFCSW
jgi:hypothetical protein